jgi:hypothetical protein
MCIHDEIDKAIAAHGAWKDKLRSAIKTGECESTPARVKQDNNCSFGKWLHERVDPALRTTSHYQQVLRLHADFHREAGSILEIALRGGKDEANQRMQMGGTFVRTSAELTKTMRAWQAAL